MYLFRSPTGHGSIQRHHKIALKQEAQSIIEFADSDINFDSAQMQALYTAIESGDKQTIVRAVSEAKQNAAEMLEEEVYREFCQYLRK